MSERSYFSNSEVELLPLDAANATDGGYGDTDNRKFNRRALRDRRAKVRFGPNMKDRREGAGRRVSDTASLMR